MGFYPISIELTDRRCIVIGGGAVAERKVEGLLEAGAAVTVVSPALTDRLENWHEAGKISWLGRSYRRGDLAGYQLAFVATDRPEINAAAAAEGRERGVWVNAADDPDHCDFILPAVLRRGELVIAIATGGSSPALARAIREELEAYFGDDYTALSSLVAEVRNELRSSGQRPSPGAWQEALTGEFRRLIRDKEHERAKAHLLARLGASRCG